MPQDQSISVLELSNYFHLHTTEEILIYLVVLVIVEQYWSACASRVNGVPQP
jgi:hypothetical protein